MSRAGREAESVLLWLFGVALLYAFWVFVTWEANPGNWAEGGRAALAWVVLCWLVAVILMHDLKPKGGKK